MTTLTGLENHVLIPPVYEKLGWTYGLNLPVNNVIGYYDGGWGLISLKNKVITPPKYYTLEAIHRGLIIASIKAKFSNELLFGVLNVRGQVVIGFKYHAIKNSQNLLVVAERKRAGTRYGLLTLQGIELLPLQYKSIAHFYDDLFVFAHRDGKIGIIHQNGAVAVKAVLDSVAPMNAGFAQIFQSGKCGMVDSTGSVWYQPQYKSITRHKNRTEIQFFNSIEIKDPNNQILNSFSSDTSFLLENGFSVVQRNDFFEIQNPQNEKIFSGKNIWEFIAFRDNLIIRQGDGYQAFKANGDLFAKNRFAKIKQDNFYLYGFLGKSWQIFNVYGSVISKSKYTDVMEGSDNLIPVKQCGYWGYMDHAGMMAIPIRYDQAGQFKGKLAKVSYLGDQRLLNEFGELLDKKHYDHIEIVDNSQAIVRVGTRYDLIDYRGNYLFQTFNQLQKHPIGYKETTDYGHCGLISSDGGLVFPPVYDAISNPIMKQFLILKKDKKRGVSDLKGNWLIPMSHEFENIVHVSEGLIGIKKDGLFGFIDFDKKLRIANRYERIHPFFEDRAAVRLKGKWGFINKKEKLVVQPTFGMVKNFRNGLAIASRVHKFGVINLDGKPVIKVAYDTIFRLNEHLFIAQKLDKYGVIDATGKMIIPVAYETIGLSSQNQFIVKRRNLMGVINENGLFSIPLKYRSIVERPDGNFMCLQPKATEIRANR